MSQNISSPIKFANKQFRKPIKDERFSYHNFLNDITRLLPVATLAVLLYGNIRVFTYYTLFNINIYDFLNFDELLKFAIRDIIPGSFIIVTLAMMSDVLEKKFMLTFIISLILILGIFILSIVYPSQILTDSLSAFGLIFGLLITIVFAEKSNINPTALGATVIFIIFIIAFHASVISYRLVTKDLINSGEYIELKSGKKIVSSSEVVYIGKTTDFIFFHNMELKKTIAYRIDEISILSIGYSF